MNILFKGVVVVNTLSRTNSPAFSNNITQIKRQSQGRAQKDPSKPKPSAQTLINAKGIPVKIEIFAMPPLFISDSTNRNEEVSETKYYTEKVIRNYYTKNPGINFRLEI